MSATEFVTDRSNMETDFNDVPQFQIAQLGIMAKSPSPEFIPDEESASICPLLTPSPTVADFRHPLDPLTATLEQKLLLEGKSPSPDYNQDEEAALLAPSPPSATFRHPLDPLSNFERQNTPSSMDTEITGISQTAISGSEVQYIELEQSRENRSSSIEGEAQGSFPAQARNSVPSELLESSASSSSFALQENTSCVQLLGNHHYQHLDVDKMNNVAAFINQENCNKQSGIDLTEHKSPPDYCFLSWNWPLIRKSCFWSVISAMVACLCIVVAMIATVPRRCYPAHDWYQGSVFYEIFPASFQDSDADGVGDLRGIASRAEYLSKLGIQTIRLNSIFHSEHYPEGFDKVKNLTEIQKSVGSLKDLQYLIMVMHNKNISVVLDLPIYPCVKDIGELRVSYLKNSRKDVADKITNVVHNHRSHRSVENETDNSDVPTLTRGEFGARKRLYIDGGIAGLMKSTSEHLNSISQTMVEEALYYWFDQGVDGVYLKGLEKYVNDSKFVPELKKWKNIKDSYLRMHGDNKMLMCDYKVLELANDENTADVILSTMDLLDVHLDLSNGTSYIKSQIIKYQESPLYKRRDYPWLHWNIGNVGTKRLSTKVENTLGAILFELLLPGTVSIFYGDEIGLQEVHDQDHNDNKHMHQLSPMRWNKDGKGFARNDVLSWLPYAKAEKSTEQLENILGNMTSLRNDAPSIYMSSIWKENENLDNYAVRYLDDSVIVLERSYPRRNSYVVVFNLGSSDVRNDLSNIYYGGELLEDVNGNHGEYITFNDLKLTPGEAYIVKLDK